ncbi:MAG: hypothetical protein PHP97_00590 [Candidatus Shapirobacteria bacterium]|nr:hypothetical protein [Candidatus Shapirobacteria bacterium]MDD3002412.1 hypothetical protein [Candidatus Shapirobacteria bacterium]MDD4383280.1 hypothetical protein [Candidatus Shapirobacteria bacterium]
MAIKKELSLLPESENPRSFRVRFFKWITTTGRVTIILTELIVISVFFSRFWLDRKNSDLSEIARQKQAILESAIPFEVEFTGLQKRLSFIKNFYSNQPEYNKQINSLVSSTPTDIFYNRISISTDEKTKITTINTSLIGYKEESIVSFITNLTLNPDISKVNITKIEKKEKENQYLISIVLQFNANKTKTEI